MQSAGLEGKSDLHLRLLADRNRQPASAVAGLPVGRHLQRTLLGTRKPVASLCEAEATLKIDMLDLGTVDLSANAVFATTEELPRGDVDT